MGSQHCNLRKASCDLFQVDRPHPAGGYILGFVKLFSQDDASMKKHDPSVAVCKFVHGKVGRIIEGLLDKL